MMCMSLVMIVSAGTGTSGYSGDSGPATQATLSGPEMIVVDTNGFMYIADTRKLMFIFFDTIDDLFGW